MGKGSNRRSFGDLKRKGAFMRGKELSQKLRDGTYVYGTHITGPLNPLTPDWYAGAGLDFAFICNEHMPLDVSETSTMCKMFAAHGVSPMVRIPYPDARLATLAVDFGAEGIVAPYVESADECREIVSALKYRPVKGRYLEELVSGKKVIGKKLAEYLDKFNENLYFVAGIESVYAIENLEKIIGAGGVSCVFLGPHDITCSMGIPLEYDNPGFISLMVDVVSRCRRMGVGVGMHGSATNPDYRPLLDAGANFMLDAADIAKATDAYKENIKIRDRYNSGK